MYKPVFVVIFAILSGFSEAAPVPPLNVHWNHNYQEIESYAVYTSAPNIPSRDQGAIVTVKLKGNIHTCVSSNEVSFTSKEVGKETLELMHDTIVQAKAHKQKVDFRINGACIGTGLRAYGVTVMQ